MRVCVCVLYDLHIFSTHISGLHPQVGSDAVVLMILLGNAQSFSQQNCDITEKWGCCTRETGWMEFSPRKSILIPSPSLKIMPTIAKEPSLKGPRWTSSCYLSFAGAYWTSLCKRHRMAIIPSTWSTWSIWAIYHINGTNWRFWFPNPIPYII